MDKISLQTWLDLCPLIDELTGKRNIGFRPGPAINGPGFFDGPVMPQVSNRTDRELVRRAAQNAADCGSGWSARGSEPWRRS